LNISGNKKFKRAHNSVRLFYNGVPVNKSLYRVHNVQRSIDSLLSLFLSL